MIAFGTLKKKAAFKLYARAKKLDFNIANKISDQIDKYDMALKYADDDEKDEINIYDFVDREYQDYVKKSEVYWGLISSKSKAPCAYMLYQAVSGVKLASSNAKVIRRKKSTSRP